MLGVQAAKINPPAVSFKKSRRVVCTLLPTELGSIGTESTELWVRYQMHKTC
ncbi:hypothetical protein VCJ_001259 [Vibrio metoecus]|nr:hypothetical protein VCJ_001259 [Vibrio metoecus]